MLPCPISSLSFHLSFLSFRRRRNLSLSFVIPTQEKSVITLCYSTYPSCHSDAGGIYYYPLSFQSLIVVIPTQEESITLCLCHSTYPSCHFDAGGIYYPLRLSFRRRR